MLQLNRFTLDMTTFNRKKINDKVAFPLVLNVNPFLDSASTDEQFDAMSTENPLNLVSNMKRDPVKPKVRSLPQKRPETDSSNQSLNIPMESQPED